jgi:hypothetical protein
MRRMPVDERCSEWRRTQLVNPETKQKITRGGPTYRRIERVCSSPFRRGSRSVADRRLAPSRSRSPASDSSEASEAETESSPPGWRTSASRLAMNRAPASPARTVHRQAAQNEAPEQEAQANGGLRDVVDRLRESLARCEEGERGVAIANERARNEGARAARLEEDNRKLNERIAALTREIESTAVEADVVSDRDRCIEALDQRTAGNTRLRQQTEQISRESDETRDQLERHRRETNEANAEGMDAIERLRTALETEKLRAGQMEAERKAARTEAAAIRSELDGMRTCRDDLRRCEVDIERFRTEGETQLGDLQAENKRLSDLLEQCGRDADQSIREWKAAFENAQAENDRIRNESASIASEGALAARLEEDNRKLNERIAALTRKIESTAVEADVVSDRDRCIEALDQRTAENTRLRQQIEQISRESDETRDQLERHRRETNEANAEGMDAIERLRTALETEKLRAGQMEAEREAARTEAAIRSESEAALQKSLSDYEAAYNNIRDKSVSAAKKYDEWALLIGTQTAEIEGLNKANADATLAIEALEEKLRAAETEATMYRESAEENAKIGADARMLLEQRASEIEDLTNKLNACNRFWTEGETRLGDLDSENKRLSDQLEQCESASIAREGAHAARHEEDNRKLNERIAALTREIERADYAEKMSVAQLQSEREAARTQAAAIRRESETWVKQIFSDFEAAYNNIVAENSQIRYDAASQVETCNTRTLKNDQEQKKKIAAMEARIEEHVKKINQLAESEQAAREAAIDVRNPDFNSQWMRQRECEESISACRKEHEEMRNDLKNQLASATSGLAKIQESLGREVEHRAGIEEIIKAIEEERTKNRQPEISTNVGGVFPATKTRKQAEQIVGTLAHDVTSSPVSLSPYESEDLENEMEEKEIVGAPANDVTASLPPYVNVESQPSGSQNAIYQESLNDLAVSESDAIKAAIGDEDAFRASVDRFSVIRRSERITDPIVGTPAVENPQQQHIVGTPAHDVTSPTASLPPYESEDLENEMEEQEIVGAPAHDVTASLPPYVNVESQPSGSQNAIYQESLNDLAVSASDAIKAAIGDEDAFRASVDRFSVIRRSERITEPIVGTPAVENPQQQHIVGTPAHDVTSPTASLPPYASKDLENEMEEQEIVGAPAHDVTASLPPYVNVESQLSSSQHAFDQESLHAIAAGVSNAINAAIGDEGAFRASVARFSVIRKSRRA